MKDKLPLYTIHISDKEWSEEEVDFVSLVEYPAIQKNFIAFNSDYNKQKILFNEEQRILSGAVMVADLPIYRNNQTLGEHFVMFTKDEIKKIVQRFFKKGYQSNVNLEHSKKVNGVYMFESYIIDRENGKHPMKNFEDVTDGSWWASYKVENDDVWQDAKNGVFKGFSIEGIFNYETTDKEITTEEQLMNEIIKILNKIEH